LAYKHIVVQENISVYFNFELWNEAW